MNIRDHSFTVTHVSILDIEDLTCRECGREHWSCECNELLPAYQGSDPSLYHHKEQSR